MSITAAASGFVVFLLSVPVIQGQNDYGVTYTSNEICALKGSTVEIGCSYTYPSKVEKKSTKVKKKLWFTKGSNDKPVNLTTDRDYTGRVEYLFHDDDSCNVRIKDLRESDSAEYKFRFITNQEGGKLTGLPGVTLSVTDLQVQVEGSSTEAELKCHSRCNIADHTSYVWYNNGEKMDEETSSHRVSVSDNGNYSCAVKGHEDHRSPPVYSPTVPSVSVSPSEVVMSSSVTLTCRSDANPAATYTWHKSGASLRSSRNEPELVFSSIQSSDSGQYYCTAVNKLGSRTSRYVSINVKYAPKLPSVSVSPSAEIVEGSSVTLTCLSDANPAATYTWYKKNRNPGLLPSKQTRNVQSSRNQLKLVLWYIQSSDSGEYYCTAQNDVGTASSESISINVKYAPKLLSVSARPSPDVEEGSSVTLTCSSDGNPPAKYTWHKKTGHLRPLSEEQQLVLRSIQSSDSGEYYCTAENELGKASEDITINVRYAPKLPSVSVSPSAEIVEGSSVTLTCSSDANPAATYTWYKENQKLLQGPEGSYNFTSISSEDRGIYFCKSENPYGQIMSSSISVDVQYAPKLPSVSVSPSAEIVEGSSVTLTCSSDANLAANYTWYKENEDSPKASGQIFTITDFTAEHSGNYYCEAQNTRGRHNSTLHLIAVADKSTMMINVIIRLTVVVMMPIPLLLFSLWMRKKKTLSSTTEPNEPKETLELDSAYENVSDSAAQREDAEEQEDLV